MPELTDADRDIIARADEVLDEHSAADEFSMASRIGQLEHHLDAVLRLAKRLGGD